MKFLGDLETYLNDAVEKIQDTDESLLKEELGDGDIYEITFAPGEEYKVAEQLLNTFEELLSEYDAADVYKEVCLFVTDGTCKLCDILPCEFIVEQPIEESKCDSKLEDIWGSRDLYKAKDGWTEDDIKLHKSIDWKARDYLDYPVTDDTFTGTAYCYGFKHPLTKEVKMCKYIRSNPIFPPYYAAIEDPFKDFHGVVGPMFDGRKHKTYDIHDRYETQDLYDLLSEKLNIFNNMNSYDIREFYKKSMMSTNKAIISEAFYGGAFDIDEYQFFTKEELVEFANTIIDQLKENNINRNIDLSDLYMENNQLTIELDINGYIEKSTAHIDMRRIKLPRDIEKYKDIFVMAFEDLCQMDKVDD